MKPNRKNNLLPHSFSPQALKIKPLNFGTRRRYHLFRHWIVVRLCAVDKSFHVNDHTHTHHTTHTFLVHHLPRSRLSCIGYYRIFWCSLVQSVLHTLLTPLREKDREKICLHYFPHISFLGKVMKRQHMLWKDVSKSFYFHRTSVRRRVRRKQSSPVLCIDGIDKLKRDLPQHLKHLGS